MFNEAEVLKLQHTSGSGFKHGLSLWCTQWQHVQVMILLSTRINSIMKWKLQDWETVSDDSWTPADVVLTSLPVIITLCRSTRPRTSPWRSEDASWSLSSTTPRSRAWWWASYAAPTSPPWTPTASPTPTSKRQYANRKPRFYLY